MVYTHNHTLLLLIFHSLENKTDMESICHSSRGVPAMPYSYHCTYIFEYENGDTVIITEYLTSDFSCQITYSFNRYSYVWNNPFKYEDPSGEFITWSISKKGISIGFNLSPIGIPLGGGINIGWSGGGSAGVYGEVGYRVGGTGLGAGATISQSLDYGFGSNSWSTTTGAGVYGSLGLFNAGANVSYNHTYNSWGWGVGGGINLFGSKNGTWGMGINVGYGSDGWTYGAGGYYNPRKPKIVVAVQQQDEHKRRVAEFNAKMQELIAEHSTPKLLPQEYTISSIEARRPDADLLMSTARNGFNVDQAVNTLNLNARDNSVGRCARYVRIALEAGGIDTTGRPVSARDYGPHLERWGFRRIETANYVAGDIVVMQAPPGSVHGHIQMHNGSQWVSDFRQSGFWPGSSYRNHKPSFQIFRW